MRRCALHGQSERRHEVVMRPAANRAVLVVRIRVELDLLVGKLTHH
jgi:hypothetical protein